MDNPTDHKSDRPHGVRPDPIHARKADHGPSQPTGWPEPRHEVGGALTTGRIVEERRFWCNRCQWTKLQNIFYFKYIYLIF